MTTPKLNAPATSPASNGSARVAYPDVLFLFPNHMCKMMTLWDGATQWAHERGWLPKDSDGNVTLENGQRAEIWGGRIEGTRYIALRFLDSPNEKAEP